MEPAKEDAKPKVQAKDIIYPPPEIISVIEKTAKFVQNYGVQFEKRALNENNEKLTFLRPDNPYRAYYEMRLAALQGGDTSAPLRAPKPEGLKQIEKEDAEKKAKEAEKKDNKSAKAKNLMMLTDAAGGASASGGDPPAGGSAGVVLCPEIPEDDRYTVLQPSVAPLDLDIIKTTAQFVARNGGKFLMGLSKREENNPQFEFLKPTCYLFPFFTKLCDAFTKIMAPKDKSHIQMLRAISGRGPAGENKKQAKEFIMKRAMARYAYKFNARQYDEKMRKEKDDKRAIEQRERETMEAIDWNDFVVVETIQFTEEDEKIALQAPVDFTKMKPEATLDPEMAPTIDIEEEAMDMDIDDAEQDMEASEEGKAVPAPPAPVEPEKPKEPEAEKPKEPKEPEKQEVVQADEISVPAMEPVSVFEVRDDYVRKAKTDDVPLQKCALTGEMIPADQMPEHMRILLMDPKYKVQRDKALERAKSENVMFDDVERNLGAFAANRPDLFGTIDEEIEKAAAAGNEQQAREAGADAGPAHTVYNPEMNYMQQRQFGVTPGSSAPALQAPPPAAAPAGNTRDRPQDDEESDDEPEAKRRRIIADLIPEAEFLAANPTPVTFVIAISRDLDTGDKSELEVTLKVKTRVEQLKKSIGKSLQLRPEALKFINQSTNMALHSSRTLAYYNIGPKAILRLEPRSGMRANL